MALHICRNHIYLLPPCEWILNTLPQTVQNPEDPVMILVIIIIIIIIIMVLLPTSTFPTFSGSRPAYL